MAILRSDVAEKLEGFKYAGLTGLPAMDKSYEDTFKADNPFLKTAAALIGPALFPDHFEGGLEIYFKIRPEMAELALRDKNQHPLFQLRRDIAERVLKSEA